MGESGGRVVAGGRRRNGGGGGYKELHFYMARSSGLLVFGD